MGIVIFPIQYNTTNFFLFLKNNSETLNKKINANKKVWRDMMRKTMVRKKRMRLGG